MAPLKIPLKPFKGAYYYITKPLDINGLISLINKALEYQSLSDEVQDLTRKKKRG